VEILGELDPVAEAPPAPAAVDEPPSE